MWAQHDALWSPSPLPTPFLPPWSVHPSPAPLAPASLLRAEAEHVSIHVQAQTTLRQCSATTLLAGWERSKGTLYCSHSSTSSVLPPNLSQTTGTGHTEAGVEDPHPWGSISFLLLCSLQDSRARRWTSAPAHVPYSPWGFDHRHSLGLAVTREGSGYRIWMWPSWVVVLEVSCMYVSHAAPAGPWDTAWSLDI